MKGEKKAICVYNKENVLVMKFPLRWVEYGEIYYEMVERVGHFREQPYIEE